MTLVMQKRILIADDDPALAQAIAIRCRTLGIDCEVAHDALAALKKIDESRFDLICLDENMPSGSGLSVCEMLTHEPKWKSVPVIILTGSEQPETIMRCHQLCAYYVLKCDNVWSRVEPLL